MAADTKSDDFYTRLVEFADDGQPAEAAAQILSLHDVNAQMDMLQRVARHIEHDLVFAENLDFGSDFFLKLMYARDNATALAGHFSRSVDISGTRAGFFARALARSNRLALILADPLRHSDTDDGAAAQKSKLAHDRLINLNQIIAGVLNELTADDDSYTPAVAPIPDSSSSPITLIFRGVETLTPQSLAAQLVPYLQAVAEIHAAVDRVTDEDGRDVKVLAIVSGAGVAEVTFEQDTSVIEVASILRDAVFRQYRREYLLKKEALANDSEKIRQLLSDTAERIVKNMVNQIFHLPVPVEGSTLNKLTITQQMRSLKMDIQQKTLTTQLLSPVEFALGSPLEVVEVVFKNAQGS
jgi:hypothetical protein